MIDTLALKGEIIKNGKNCAEIAEHLGISTKTFYNKLKRGVFDSDEIEEMIVILNIQNPMSIFFVNSVT